MRETNKYRPGYDPYYGEYLGLRGPGLIWVREGTEFWLEIVEDIQIAFREHEKNGRGMAIVLANGFSRETLEERKTYLEGIYQMEGESDE